VAAFAASAQMSSGTASARSASRVVAALTSLHQRGLAHLDLKPDNIVLRDGRPLLIDFGTARRIGSRTLRPGTDIPYAPVGDGLLLPLDRYAGITSERTKTLCP
jgi:serine/threonine protein kinase